MARHYHLLLVWSHHVIAQVRSATATQENDLTTSYPVLAMCLLITALEHLGSPLKMVKEDDVMGHRLVSLDDQGEDRPVENKMKMTPFPKQPFGRLWWLFATTAFHGEY